MGGRAGDGGWITQKIARRNDHLLNNFHAITNPSPANIPNA